MKDKKYYFGIFCALLSNIIFGFSFIFSKMALSVSHPLIILSVRFTFAFVFLNILLLSGKFKISLKGKPKTKLLLMGLAQPLLYFIFELYGLSMVSSALSGVIIALVPVVVIILARITLNENATVLQTICTMISIIGVCAISLISNNGSKNHFLGIILLVCAVICASVFNILSRSESAYFSPFERTYVMFLMGVIGFNLIAVSTLKESYFPLLISSLSNINFLIAIVYLSLFSSVLAFLLYNFSTTVISVIQSSSFSNIITAVTVLAGVIILKESFSVFEYILCIIIVLGVWGVNVFTTSNNWLLYKNELFKWTTHFNYSTSKSIQLRLSVKGLTFVSATKTCSGCIAYPESASRFSKTE